jgi:hypothetical protein
LHDPVTGYMPNYGANDGSLILPLNNCDYRDYRPVLQASHYYLYGKRCFESGPWDEDLLWLFGPEALDSEIIERKPKNLKATYAGYYTLAFGRWFFISCGAGDIEPDRVSTICCMPISGGKVEYCSRSRNI